MAAGARDPTDRSGGTGRLAISSSKRLIFRLTVSRPGRRGRSARTVYLATVLNIPKTVKNVERGGEPHTTRSVLAFVPKISSADFGIRSHSFIPSPISSCPSFIRVKIAILSHIFTGYSPLRPISPVLEVSSAPVPCAPLHLALDSGIPPATFLSCRAHRLRREGPPCPPIRTEDEFLSGSGPRASPGLRRMSPRPEAVGSPIWSHICKEERKRVTHLCLKATTVAYPTRACFLVRPVVSSSPFFVKVVHAEQLYYRAVDVGPRQQNSAMF